MGRLFYFWASAARRIIYAALPSFLPQSPHAVPLANQPMEAAMTPDDLGATAARYSTNMAHAMTLAVVVALIEGSEYGFERTGCAEGDDHDRA